MVKGLVHLRTSKLNLKLVFGFGRAVTSPAPSEQRERRFHRNTVAFPTVPVPLPVPLIPRGLIESFEKALEW